MFIKLKNLLKALALSFVLFSCGTTDIIEPTENQTFGIRHDRSLSDYESAVTSATDHPDFGAVVMFSYTLDGKSDEYIGSGTLIAPNWILTAGHNFFVKDEQKNPASPADITVFTGNNPNNPDQTLSVEQIYFHPTWLQDNQDFVNANDLCLVKLKTAVKNITPVPLYTGTEEPIGSKVWYCGFGDYSKLKGQDSDLYSKKHAIENILDRKATGIITKINGLTYNGGLLAFDFDAPAGNSNTLGDSYIGEDEALLGTGTSSPSPLDLEGTTVQGDSGGPLFIKDNGEWKIAGVLSGGVPEPVKGQKDSSYGDISVFIRVSNSKGWIGEMVK
ncbi:MAG: trypsin-like serine protease [Spirosomataceae bacterium]|jgi:V8-like Glu-specific endopeptidase